MRKFYIVVGIFVSITALLFSCSKNDDQKDAPLKGEKIYLSLIADIPEYAEETKGEASQVARLFWDDGDKVYVFDESSLLGSLSATVVDGSNGTRAKLNGTIDAPQGTYIYLLTSPNFSGEPSISDGTVEVDMTEQGNDNTFAAYSTLEFDKTEITDLVVQFTFATTTLAVNTYNLPSSMKLNSAILTGVSDICKMKLSEGSVDVSGEKSKESVRIRKTFTNLSSSKDGEAMFVISVAPSEAASLRILRMSSDVDNYFDFGFFKNKMGAEDYIWTVCKMTQPESGNATFSVSATEKAYIATGNMYWDGNAEKYKFESEQYYFRNFYGDNAGSAFLDGEKTVTPDNTVGSFYWSSSAETARSLQRTGTLESAATFFTDRDDFKINGSEIGYWKTMTQSQMTYLLETRSESQMIRAGGLSSDARFAFIVVNGVKGLLIFPDIFIWDESTMGTLPAYINKQAGSQAEWATASYSKTEFMNMEAYGCKFLPAAGYRSYSDGHLKISQAMQDETSYGYYWSSTLQSDKAYCLFFRGKNYEVQSSALNRAYQIRPIHIVTEQ